MQDKFGSWKAPFAVVACTVAAADCRPPATASIADPPQRPIGLLRCSAGDPARAETETFIATAYRKSHGASLADFLPELIVHRSGAGAIRTAAGLQGAARAGLFLEQYLDSPIDALIAEHFERAVHRKRIAEIGNFASSSPLAAQAFMRLLPAYLQQRGFEWIAFTATRTLRGLLDGIGAPYQALCAADPGRLPGGSGCWGSYYTQDPQVIVGHLPSFQPVRA